jgi:hypothetical protein
MRCGFGHENFSFATFATFAKRKPASDIEPPEGGLKFQAKNLAPLRAFENTLLRPDWLEIVAARSNHEKGEI